VYFSSEIAPGGNICGYLSYIFEMVHFETKTAVWARSAGTAFGVQTSSGRRPGAFWLISTE